MGQLLVLINSTLTDPLSFRLRVVESFGVEELWIEEIKLEFWLEFEELLLEVWLENTVELCEFWLVKIEFWLKIVAEFWLELFTKLDICELKVRLEITFELELYELVVEITEELELEIFLDERLELELVFKLDIWELTTELELLPPFGQGSVNGTMIWQLEVDEVWFEEMLDDVFVELVFWEEFWELTAEMFELETTEEFWLEETTLELETKLETWLGFVELIWLETTDKERFCELFWINELELVFRLEIVFELCVCELEEVEELAEEIWIELETKLEFVAEELKLVEVWLEAWLEIWELICLEILESRIELWFWDERFEL